MEKKNNFLFLTGMKKLTFFILVSVLGFFGFSQNVFAEVSQLVFTTNPQTIQVNSSSEVITLQLQNSSGSLENATETIDLTFTSTSPTGQFLSATTPGNPVVARINTGSANKNFLYQDSAAGTYTISVTATGRTSLKTFTANQQIIISSGSSSGSSGQTATTTDATQDTSNTNTPTVTSGGISAHSSSAPLGDSEGTIQFEVSAGRDRLTTVGNSLTFQAVSTKLQNIREQSVIYTWSFGDGTTQQGKYVSHAFKFPGDYSVVLNGTAAELQAVSRIKVTVISPDISIQRVSDGVEIWNKSKMEINLEGWVLSGSKKTFTFPKDTLIDSNKKVIFGNEVTGVNEVLVKLYNPIGKIVAQTVTPETVPANLDAIQTQIEDVRVRLAQITPDAGLLTDQTMISIYKYPNQDQPTNSNTVEIKAHPKENSDQVANVNQVFEAEKKPGFISRLFAWPIRGFNFIRSLFVEE